MVRVEIVASLAKEIKKKFSAAQANEIIDLIETIEESQRKGKLLGVVGGIVVKELKYKSFRFYFLADGHKLKFYSEEELVDVLLRFVRMSHKKYQQRVIDEIKHVLKTLGPRGFE